MSQISSAKVQCPSCGVSQNISFYSSITATINPELRDAVLNGTFFDVSCAKCRTVMTLDRPVLYSDPQKRWMVWYLPHGANSESNDAMDVSTLMLGSLTKRRVVYSHDELVEKVHTIESGLNDWALVLFKMKLSKQVGATCFFAGLTNDGTRLQFKFPNLNQVQTTPYTEQIRYACRKCESLEEGLEWVYTSEKTLLSLGAERLKAVMSD